MTARDVRRALVARVRAAGPAFWLFALAVTTITNLIDFAAVPAPGTRPGPAFIAAAVVRVLVVFYAMSALAREMLGEERPFALGAAFARLFLFELALTIANGSISGMVARTAGGARAPLATQWAVLLGSQALWGVALIAIVGIAAGLASGARWRDVPGIVRASRGARVGMAIAYLQMILPFAAIHGALTLLAVRLPLAPAASAALALVDGVASAIQLLLAVALSATAYARAVRLHEGAGTG